MTRKKLQKTAPPGKPKENQALEAEPINPEERLGRLISAQYRESFSGPLPHPELLQRYNEIVPGSAKQIIDIFESQTKHRMELEKKVIGGDSLRAYIGLGCGLAVSLATFYLAYLLIISGNPIPGALLSGINLVGLVGVFVYGTQTRRQERVEKEEIRQKHK